MKKTLKILFWTFFSVCAAIGALVVAATAIAGISIGMAFNDIEDECPDMNETCVINHTSK